MVASLPAPAAAPSLVDRFALDVQAVDSLRRTARSSPDAAARAVANQFEALFMGMLLKSMREATPAGGLFDGAGTAMYRSLLDQQLAQHLSGRGLRLADALYAQMRRSLPVTAPAPGSSDTSALQVSPAAASRAAAPALPAAPLPASSDRGGGAHSAAQSVHALADHMQAFVARIGTAARQAAAATGLPERLIVAQAALESAWGRRELRGTDGAASFNLFGIKADAAWRGRVVESVTTEVVAGVSHRVRAAFRAYGSYEEAFADYAHFLASNPRYGTARTGTDAEGAARALQRAGYATDPDYASKLVRVMRQLSS